MAIEISKKEIKKFIQAAMPIKDTNIIPVYSYVKLVCDGGTATFYKTNGSSFVSCDVKAKFDSNTSLLIEAKTLFGFVEHCEGSEIEIDSSGGKVLITDKKRKASCQTIEDVFPEIPQPSEEKYRFDNEMLSAMFLAKNHTQAVSDKLSRPWTSFVHLTKVDKLYYVTGVNGSISYIKSFKDKIPLISIDPDVIPVISKYSDLTYCMADRYHYFDAGEVAYGFLGHEMKCPDLTQFVNNLKSEDGFIVERKKILSFCESVVSMNKSNIPPEISLVDAGKSSIKLKFVEISGDQSEEEEIAVEGKKSKVNEFIFQPKNMITVLKDLGVEKIKMAYCKHNFIISSEEEKGYFGSIMELAKLKND